ncbi:phage terminase large subunit [Paenisporosarcina cavernae]|uniref:Terminase n=1 Tax=Paenisporosarcina cavernae TaxID=2320858 RepID=A0A385YSA1_9BACL|nr:phage terminase large subunit [Paenisporosarcina cavernae]AYC29649.1 terminase [Paenisporosarcina cavernae]AYC30013.1 terminase [Paenisporosarcina cavernae]
MKTSSLKLPSLDEVKKAIARRNYIDYVVYAHEGRYQIAPHTEFIGNIIQSAVDKKKRMRDGDIPTENQYIAINMPPRHSKSMTITETAPSYYLGHFPEDRVIEISYNDTFARKFGKKNKEKIRQYGNDIFGIEIAKDSSAHDEWTLSNNIGGMISRGVLSGITGQGADLMIIDDPIKNREEANSENHREKIWDEWIDSFSSRLHPGAIVILILTRWHEDDLQGRLLNPEYGQPLNWEVYNFPLEAEENDLLGRKIGEPLWPERYSYSFIAERKRYPASFNSLYQGRPTAHEGNMVKRDWWKKYDTLPVLQRMIISVDATFKDSDTSDYVSIQAWGKTGINAYLVDRDKRRMDFPTTLEAIKTMKKRYPKATGIFIEDKANGSAIISMLRKHLPGIIPVNPKGSKIARVSAVSDYIRSGNVWVPKNEPWTTEFIDEWSAFPRGKNDDDVDSGSQALNKLFYYNADVPEAHDPDNPTPKEIHESAVRTMTGGSPQINDFMDWD